ncbi:hypothetical protein MFMK1_001357 [Metallumcola ferriviriculae]|uniref:HTH marR-type domain-containing protein n=1 Tax=Metallumcola ferriviriculae TaxID=3039180 RepID=A0AAU0UMZ5_9FIRM|nr:hypothetical protein MFMK1_001357 [Desulfitibacteraceae bacterium MK1]
MDKADLVSKQKYIFGSLFVLSNKLQVVMDRQLSQYDMTAKQWFLTAVIEEFFSTPPTLTELAEAMGSTHQNVKQIALKLQKKDFVEIIKDDKDRRVTRVRLTKENDAFWKNRSEETSNFFQEFFQDLGEEETGIMLSCLDKLYEGLLTIETKLD